MQNVTHNLLVGLLTHSIVLAPRNKGNWRGRNRRGHNNGRYPNQERYRQQKDSSDKRDGFNQPQRRGAMPDRRPPARSFYQASVDSKRVCLLFTGIIFVRLL